jgi:quercetin dioxygenase-like cupin family protein
MLAGTFELTIKGVTQICDAGDVAAVFSNTLHSGRALMDCRIIGVLKEHPAGNPTAERAASTAYLTQPSTTGVAA